MQIASESVGSMHEHGCYRNTSNICLFSIFLGDISDEYKGVGGVLDDI